MFTKAGLFNELKTRVTLTVVVSWTSDNLTKKESEKNGVPKGIRTPVAAVKGRSPGPLDDGDVEGKTRLLQSLIPGSETTFCGMSHPHHYLVELGGIEPPTSTLPVLRSPS